MRLNHPYLRIAVLEGETMPINYYMSLIILAEDLIVFTKTSMVLLGGGSNLLIGLPGRTVVEEMSGIATKKF